MRISEKRKVGEILGRNGISERIMTLAGEIANGTYKDAITKAGQIKQLVDAATYDEYWYGKAREGEYRELALFEDINAGNLTIDKYLNENT